MLLCSVLGLFPPGLFKLPDGGREPQREAVIQEWTIRKQRMAIHMSSVVGWVRCMLGYSSIRWALSERPGRRFRIGALIDQALAPSSGCRGFFGPVPQPL